MYIYKEDTVIPVYPFQPDSTVGNKMFSIHKCNAAKNFRKHDFLVPHRRDYYFFALVSQGSSRHWVDLIPYTLQPDTLYFTVPHQVHQKEVGKPFTGIVFSFNKDFLAMDDTGLLKNLPVIQNPHNGHELQLNSQHLAFINDLLEKLYTEYHAKNDWQSNMLLAYVKILLIYISRLYTEQISEAEQLPDRALLKKYLVKIEESYKQLHEVAAYAANMNISAGHLSERVKEQSGRSAIAHIHERLILEAKRMLLHTDYAIKEIAFELGFEDASYFNRFFKRLASQTPAAYRTAIREMYH